MSQEEEEQEVVRIGLSGDDNVVICLDGNTRTEFDRFAGYRRKNQQIINLEELPVYYPPYTKYDTRGMTNRNFTINKNGKFNLAEINILPTQTNIWNSKMGIHERDYENTKISISSGINPNWTISNLFTRIKI